MYVGNTSLVTQETYVVNDTGKIAKQLIAFNPAFIRTVIEIGSNAVDNSIRSKTTPRPCTYISFDYDAEGVLTLVNDGNTIPITLSSAPGYSHMYNPSIVFGVFMSSTNFNDKEERHTSGRNGYGAKLTNTFSKFFEVDIYDEERNLRFYQRWEDNMNVVYDPIVRKGTAEERKQGNHTSIRWLPDYARFRMQFLDTAVVSKIHKYFYDVAMFTKVSTYFHGEKLHVKSIQDYVSLWYTEQKVLLAIQTPTCEVCVVDSAYPGIISFVNGIPTERNGVHVNHWREAIFESVVAKINSAIDTTLKPQDVRNALSLFVNTIVDKPSFTGQNKDELASPKPYKWEVDSSIINKIVKWKSIADMVKAKEIKRVNERMKEISKKKPTLAYDKANHLGIHSNLFYCEGDSAKTFIVDGLSTGLYGKKGRDYNGILPCRGKILNVRNNSIDTILANKEVEDLINIIGLQFNVDYTLDENYKKLNYGTMYIVADADEDGTHIEGLCLNLFHHLFPSLLKRPGGFLRALKTPTVTIEHNNQITAVFYSHSSFKKYEASVDKIQGTIKYYKGLGSYGKKKTAMFFSEKILHYYIDEETDQSMVKAFDSSYSDARKEWIASFDPSNTESYLDLPSKEVAATISQFVDTQLVSFSVSNCERSLPNVMDGLKQSQRKILYTCFKTNKTHKSEAIKVINLASLTSANTQYIHGEQNLADTITGMIWSFPGSNNVPLLYPEGHCGTRNGNGKDAASARYIFTKPMKSVEFLFRKEDRPILNYLVNENVQIEPDFYVPVLPMILINGATGIATGWSTQIPSYHPHDILACVKMWIGSVEEGNKGKGAWENIELTPYYHGFRGTIVHNNIKQRHPSHLSYKTYGVATVDPKKYNVLHVTEIPIGMSIDAFKVTAQTLVDEKKLKSYTNNSTSDHANFTLTFPSVLTQEDYDAFLDSHLSSSISTANMVAFNHKNRITKYNTVLDILQEFCSVRYNTYVLRKRKQMKELEEELLIAKNKCRFISLINDGTMVITKKKLDAMVQMITELQFDKYNGSYKYLIDIPIYKMTDEEVEVLQKQVKKLEQDVQTLKNTKVTSIWRKELDEVDAFFQKHGYQ